MIVMERGMEPEEESCRLGPGPFFFSGRPPFIRGTVNLLNSSAERVRVRSIVLGTAGLTPYRARRRDEARERTPDGQQVDSLEVRVSRQIGPFEQANLPAQLVVDRFTPPGEYEAQLRFRDQQAQATIFVLEHHRLYLVPDRIAITVAAGETIVKKIAITNDGNVPFSTRKAGFAPLEALGILHRSLAIALTEAGHEGHAKFLDRFVSELADNEVQPAKVRFDIQDQEIAPGETKLVELSIRFPADLKRKRIYTSRISFREQKLAVEVDVNGSPDQPNAKSRRALG